MTNSVSSLVALTGKSLVGLTPVLAQATGGGTTAQLQQSFNLALGIVFFFGFIWGVIKIWSGANALSKGDADGKMGIVAGIIIAGAAAIMGAFFAIFNISGATLTPSF
jgi:ABC-type transporter Mla maintaining outer membrane lipid asymmetry permease subunit MlaE